MALHPQALTWYNKLNYYRTKMATYVWIDEDGEGVKCITRTLNRLDLATPISVSLDGSGHLEKLSNPRSNHISLKPVATYDDPFTRNKLHASNILVMCETINSDGTPTETNHRDSCLKVMKRCKKDERPSFSIEQEYFLTNSAGHPLGWPEKGFLEPHSSYCSVGFGCNGRTVMETHYQVCLSVGINLSGANAGAMPAQVTIYLLTYL